ncbi:MAG: hypothetical protein AAF580_02355 [Pseudomonadota bacterium]
MSELAMEYKARFLWGLLAGVAVVCVKVIGLDQTHIRSLFIAGTLGAVAFYLFQSIITIILGGISGLFSDEKTPAKLLVFCASFPALISTALAPEKSADSVSEVDRASVTQPVFGGLVPKAPAQQVSDPTVCNEGRFFQQFSKAAREFWDRQPADESWWAVAYSIPDLEQATTRAEELSEALQESGIALEVNVGCRRPGNEFYPVIVGQMSDQARAAEVAGILEGAQILPHKPYLSNYAWRTPIHALE